MEGGLLSHTPAISSGVDLRLDLGFKTKGLSLLDDRFAYTAREMSASLEYQTEATT